jgi:5'-3' exonuclease
VRTVILIDARNYTHRHGYTHRGLTSMGRASGMMYGCISGMARLARLHPGAAIIFCWDGDEPTKSWRHQLSIAYKAHRIHATGEQPKPEVVAMFQQIPVFENFLSMLGFQQLKVKSLEADDLIGILAFHIKSFVDKVIIYSTDRDFFQFVSSEIDVVRDQDKSANCRPITAKKIKAEYGIMPKDWLKYRALVGDKGDGIHGIAKCGPVAALSALSAGIDPSKKYWKNTAETKDKKVQRAVDLVRQNYDQARLNYTLSKILRTVDEKKLAAYTALELKFLLRQKKCFSDMLRNPEGKTKEKYRQMLGFFGEWEFAELMDRRLEIWNLP